MANGPARIVLPEEDRPRADAILQATGIKTLSQLFSIFLVNYGEHLVAALKTPPVAPPPPVVMPPSVAQPKQLPTIQPPPVARPETFKPMSI